MGRIGICLLMERRLSRIGISMMVVYCFLLFAAGIVFGFLFSDNGQIQFVTSLGAISSLATIAAAIAAVSALQAWHAQFKHSEKYKAVLKFKESLDRGESACALIHAVSQHVEEQNVRTYHASLSDLQRIRSSATQAWVKQSYKVEQAWNDLERLMPAGEIRKFSCSPDQLEKDVMNFITYLEDVTFDRASVDICKLSKEAQAFSSKIRDGNVALMESANVALKDLMT